MIGTLQGPWFLGTALLLLAVAIRRTGRKGEACLAPTETGIQVVAIVAVLAVLATAARLAFGLWGPLHVNGQGPLWIRGTLDAAALAGYGPGYFELFGWAARFGPAVDRAVFAANAVLSGISPAILYITARVLGVGGGGALAAAAVLAADPVTIRTAASEGYHTALIALVLAVQVSLAVAARAYARGDRAACMLSLFAAGLMAASAARIHPLAYLPLACSPLVVFGSAHLDTWRARASLTLLAAAVVAAVVLVTSASIVRTALGASPMTAQALAGMHGNDTLLVAGALALAVLVSRVCTPPWLALLAVCSTAALLATQNAFQQSPLWKLCYQRIYLPGIVLGAAALVPRAALWGVAGASVVAVLLFNAARAHLDDETTEQLEYRFLQESLAGMPAHCTLAAVSQAQSRIWEIPSYLVPETSGQRVVTSVDDLRAAPGGCLLYVRSSLCSSAEGRGACEAVERVVPLQPVARHTFPPLPSYAGLPYDREQVEVVVFRVTEHTVGVNDGAAITPAFAQRFYEQLQGLRESDGCSVTRLDTSRFRMTIGVRPPAGGEHVVEVATAAPGTAAASASGWTVVASEDGRRACGIMITALERVLRDLGAPGAN